MRALVVDDSRAMRAIVGRILSDSGFVVAYAEHGKAALEVLGKEAPFDIAVVDWNMPEMSGIELVHAVRTSHQYDAMRIMMVTTETDFDHVTRALDAGAHEYLMKPFPSEAFVEKLALLGLVSP